MDSDEEALRHRLPASGAVLRCAAGIHFDNDRARCFLSGHSLSNTVMQDISKQLPVSDYRYCAESPTRDSVDKALQSTNFLVPWPDNL